MGKTKKQKFQDHFSQLLHRDPTDGLCECADLPALRVLTIGMAITLLAYLAVHRVPTKRGPSILPITPSTPSPKLVLDPQIPPRIPTDRVPGRPLRTPPRVHSLWHFALVPRFPAAELRLPGALLDSASVADLPDGAELRGALRLYVDLEYSQSVPVYCGV